MEAGNRNIAHKAQSAGKGKGIFPPLLFANTGMMKTVLSGFSFLFLFSAIQLSAQPAQTYSTAGTFTFTVPAGVTSLDVQAWGGGGCAGNNTGRRACGGGGGGAYTGGTINVTPGATLTVVVGAGGIYGATATATDDGVASSAGAIVANGGLRGLIDNNAPTDGGNGGSISPDPGGITSFVSYAGGKGGNGYVAGTNGGGGGGGESASSSGAGNPGGNGSAAGIGGAGGTGNIAGGDGGRGSNNDGTPNSADGASPGGGAGGRGDDNGANRDGGDGQVIISWAIPPGYCSNNALSILNQTGVINPDNSLGAPDAAFATLDDLNDQLTLTLTSGDILSSGGSIDVRWRRNAWTSANPRQRVDISTDGITWTTANTYTITSLTWVTQNIPLSINTRYIQFTETNAYNLDLDAISYYTPCTPPCTKPAVYSLTGGGSYCSGGPGLPVGLSGSESGIEYQLYLESNAQGSPVAGTGGALNFGNQLSAGNYTVIATRITGGCNAPMNGNAIISVNFPAQPSVINGLTSSCIGNSQIYSVTNIPGMNYAWTFPAGWTQTAGGTSNAVTVTAGPNAGDISVTPSNACGNGTARILSVTSTTIPAQPGTINGPVAPCAGTAMLNYVVPNVAGITYTWAFPAGWSVTAGQSSNSVTVTAGAIAGNVTVTPSNICGNGPAQTLALIPNAVPAQPGIISGNISPCQGTAERYSITNEPGIAYTWALPMGWIQTGGGISNSILVTVGSGSGNISVMPSNAFCNGPARNLAITTRPAAPSTPGFISGKATQCPGLAGQTYSIAAVANATNYTWTVPTGWIITGGTGTAAITATTGTSGQNGSISVTAGNSCGVSTAQTLAVTVGTVPTPDISANYCAGGGYIQLTANGGGAGASYLWSTGETTQKILVNIAGQYSVNVTNAAGCAATAVYSVATELVVNGDFSAGNTGFTHSTYIYEPDIPAMNTELGPEGHYGVGTDPQTYHTNFWGRDHTTNSGNFMIVNGYPGAPQPVVWATNVSVKPGVAYYFSAWALSLNSVGNYATLQFRVNNSLVGTTAPLPARPQNNTAPYNWIQFYGNWTAPAGTTSALIEIVDLQTAAAGNDFGLDDISFATLAPLPAVIAPTTNAGNGIGLCPGQTLNLYANLTGGKPPYTYTWSGPAGFTSTIANPDISNVTVANSGVYKLTITDGYGCPAVTAFTAPAKINPFPACSINGPSALCPSSSGNNFTGPAGMISYTWGITGDGTISGTNGSNVSINTGATCNGSITITLAVTDVNGCSSNCQQVLAVKDETAPTFTRPADITIFTGADCSYDTGVNATGDVNNETDYCSTGLNATFSDIMTVSDTCIKVIKRTWSLVDICGNIAVTQVQTITITDNTPPVVAAPPNKNFCVPDMQEATFEDLTTDINPVRPDWYIMAKGSTDLDLDPVSYFSDNCTSKMKLVLHWRIDFATTTPAPAVPFITGTGQPSAGSLIEFLGDALTHKDVVHTISYWIIDQCGNVSLEKSANIVIKPRPDIIKQTL
jgi:hypothetical protein